MDSILLLAVIHSKVLVTKSTLCIGDVRVIKSNYQNLIVICSSLHTLQSDTGQLLERLVGILYGVTELEFKDINASG